MPAQGMHRQQIPAGRGRPRPRPAGESSKVGLIIGISVGSVVLLIWLIVALLFLIRSP
jgi:hypothetical protein